MTISLFTPTHDSSYLPTVYASIAARHFDEWVIVLNNGAADFPCSDPRVRVLRLPPGISNVGALKAYAAAQCTGDILIELDHDDLLLPGSMAAVRDAFQNPNVGFVYSNCIHTDADLGPTKRFGSEWGWQYRAAQSIGPGLDECVSFPPTPEAVSRIWYAPNHLRAFRRTAYLDAGGYNPELRVLDDLDLMCRLYTRTRFLHLDRPLYVYRIHGANSWLKHNREIQDGVWPIYDRYIVPMVQASARHRGLRCLDLGGRFDSPPGFETVDRKDADIVCDLNEPWPFADGTVGILRAFDVFEHLRDQLHTMRECYRVLAPGGWIIGQVPSTDGRGAFQDPTHVSFWNQNSFLYYTDAHWARYIDTPVRFQAPRLFTTQPDARQVSWVKFHLISLRDGYRPPGLITV